MLEELKMAIFNIKNTSLSQIKKVEFNRERDLQNITEKNLETIFNLEFVASEFQLKNLRIDTIGFDKVSNSFAIIEYKKDKSSSVIDQGYAYLALLLNNKADFILEYNENMDGNLKKRDVDWSQSKIILLADSFNKHQKSAINFKDLPIELWEVKKYDNNTILYNHLKPLDTAGTITTVSKSSTIKDVSNEVKNYSADDVLRKDWIKTLELYESLKDKIIETDSRIEVKFTKYYVGFQINQWNVIAVYQQKEKIKVELFRTRAEDLKKIAGIEVVYREKSLKNWNQHISDFHINKIADIDYAMIIIKQVIERFDK